MSKAVTIEYRGVRFRRYPDAADDASRLYYTPGIADKKRGVKRLHQEVYEDNHGPIPEGCNVYFRDEDTENLDPANLVAQSPAEYKAEHWKADVAAAARAHADRIRPKAAAWHRSPAGREWHRRHARESFAKRQPREVDCEECGETFETTASVAKFCSQRCGARARRRKETK